MYQALEVQNIDEILPPPPQPQPLDPAIENARALMGEILEYVPRAGSRRAYPYAHGVYEDSFGVYVSASHGHVLLPHYGARFSEGS